MTVNSIYVLEVQRLCILAVNWRYVTVYSSYVLGV